MYDFKWPQLTVTGAPVTAAQAEQILIRTDDLYLHCNDQAWTNTAREIMIGVPDPWHLPAVEERLAAITAEIAAKQRLGFLQLHYLGQGRIVSSLKGSASGWCDWDGTIGARPYNIGKWPSVEEVTEDWAQIADAFPFLNLRSQLISFSSAENEPAKVWGTWTVADGAVAFDQGAIDPLELPEVAPWAPGQQPLGLDELRAIVSRVLVATEA